MANTAFNKKTFRQQIGLKFKGETSNVGSRALYGAGTRKLREDHKIP